MDSGQKFLNYHQYRAESWEHHSGSVIVETSVSLTVNGENWLSLMCTPIHLEALAVGFLFNEGLLQSSVEIADVRICDSGDNVDIWLHHAVQKPQNWRRTSGCTGGMTAVNAQAAANGQSSAAQSISVNNGKLYTPGQLCALFNQLSDAQTLYQETGGVHSSALSDGENLCIIAEDVGRHNTLDKIAGRMLLEKITLPHKVLLTTGRISSEMLQKAARIGTALVISRTAASSLAIEMAAAWGITIIGYARRDRFTVYTHPERILINAHSKTFEIIENIKKDTETIS